MSLISVIIPTHNRWPILRDAVRSVLEQGHRELELIVVDDGSTDDTLEGLKTIRDPRLHMLSQPMQGVASARNKGIAASRGEWVAFLDSDDLWLPDKLARQLLFMRAGGWIIAQTGENWVRRGKRVNPRRRHAKQAGWIFEPSLELCLVSPSCVMMHRDFFAWVGLFDERLRACEDYDLWLRASLHMPVGYLAEELVIRRGGHADQLSGSIVGQDLYRINALIKLLERQKLSSGQRSAVVVALREKARRYVQGCLKRGRFVEAERVSGLVSKAVRQMK